MAFGVTPALIEAFGEVVFDLSLNRQRRTGDPVRALDFAAIEAQRAATGLSDAEIAARIGLAPEQVRYIRVVMERRRFRTDQYRKLFELGGGRRWRPERYRDSAERHAISPSALELRAALRFAPEQVRRYLDRGWWTGDTLGGWLEGLAEQAPERPALLHGDQRLGYGDLAERVGRLAGALRELGIAKGDVVALQLPNLPAFVESYLATACLGAVTTTLHMPYREAEIEALLAHSGAKAVVCLAATKDFALGAATVALKDKLPALDHVVAVGGEVAGALSFAELAQAGAPAPLTGEAAAADPFLLLYTSGTTARPKGVPLSYQTMLSNARLGAPEHGIAVDDVILSVAPFSHLFGLYAIHLALASGAANLLLPAFAPADLAAVIAAGRPTVMLAAPAHLAAGLQGGAFERPAAAALKLVICSGSPLRPELAQAMATRMEPGRLSQLWGMTELQAGLYTRPDDPLELAATTAGRPSPGTEVRVADEAGAPLPPGSEGELQVRGCSVFAGYLRDEEASRAAFTADGWFRSGDLAVMDEAGNVRLSGRLKDVINRGGVKYNPLDVEALLDAHPAIQQAAIVALPDPVLGERACCFAVAAPGADLTLDEITAYLEAKGVAKLKWPERLELVAEMPLTPTRKIIKGRLAALLAKG